MNYKSSLYCNICHLKCTEARRILRVSFKCVNAVDSFWGPCGDLSLRARVSLNIFQMLTDPLKQLCLLDMSSLRGTPTDRTTFSSIWKQKTQENTGKPSAISTWVLHSPPAGQKLSWCVLYWDPPQPPLKDWDSGVEGVFPAMHLEQTLPSDLCAAVVPTPTLWLLESPGRLASRRMRGVRWGYKSLALTSRWDTSVCDLDSRTLRDQAGDHIPAGLPPFLILFFP